MKSILFRFIAPGIVMLLIWSCGQKDHQHDGHDHSHSTAPVEESANDALHREVMKVHDEAMAKMDQIQKLKLSLKQQLEATPSLAEEKKVEAEKTIAKLDSAYDGMMEWMHQYQPLADSVVGEEKAREYLESEMEKVKKVRQDILDALENAQ